MTKLMKKNKRGFTLVELVIVIAILAILAAVAIPTVSGVINTANTNVDISNAQTIELALKSADTQRESKTGDSAITGLGVDATVNDVLSKSGVTLTANASGEYQTRAGGKFYFVKTNTTIGVTTSSGVAFAAGQAELKSTTKMSEIFDNWD